MNLDGPIFVIEDDQLNDDQLAPSIKVKKFETTAFGENININIGYSDTQATLADIVPVAYTLASKIEQAARNDLQNRQVKVPCEEGCSAICCDNVIFLSIPEALYLIEQLQNLPQQQFESFKQTCHDISLRLDENLEEYRNSSKSEETGQIEDPKLEKFRTWYNSLNLSCPFSAEKLCSIYDDRPIVCREHLITGECFKEELCEKSKTTNDERLVKMPFIITNVLKQLAINLENNSTAVQQSIVMPSMFDWYDQPQNSELQRHSWPARQIIECFVDILLESRREWFDTHEPEIVQLKL